MHPISVQHSHNVLPPDRLRIAVLGRRISTSPEVAAVLALMAYGEPREPVSAHPNGQGGSAVEVRLIVLSGGRWIPTPHAFRHRADLAAAFAEGYTAVARSDRS